MKQPEAAHYRALENEDVVCGLCPQACRIAEGQAGICRSRINRGGKLFLDNYGRFTSLALDPIEKKPLYHFHPGSTILSIGGKGCNLKCAFCQNSGISQGNPAARDITPAQLVEETKTYGVGNIGLAFTYNEPFIWFEFIRDTAPLLREAGLKVVLATNGFVNQDPLSELLPMIDAMNIDLKAFDDEFYRKYCGGKIDPVKRTIEAAHGAGVHVEVTLLLIPGLNDGQERLHEQSAWIASVSKDIPFHISRYFPSYQLDLPPTPVRSMIDAFETARKNLNYVYLGNVGDSEYSCTKCPACGKEAIRRQGYSTDASGLKGSDCAACGGSIAVRVA